MPAPTQTVVTFAFVALLSCEALAQSPAASPHNLRQLDQLIAQKPRGKNKLVPVDDMWISRTWLQRYRQSLTPSNRKTRATAVTTTPLWTNGVVYYTFDPNVTPIHQRAFLDAANEWKTWANVTFVARTAEPNYIVVSDGGADLDGGNASVGMISGAGHVTIGSASWYRGTLIHELGHVLGFYHEQQRPDRDSYVTILTANIISGKSGNFTLIGSSNPLRSYDFRSIMHYSRTAWSIDPATLNTIEPLPAYSQYLTLMGNSYPRHLSPDDRASIALLYGAPPVGPSAVVTNTQDSGSGSLRAAIYYAVDHPGTTITFQIPTTDPGFDGSVFTIRPTDRLPGLPDNTTLDGTSQTTFVGDTNVSGPEIVLSGALSLMPDITYEGLIVADANCTVKGIVVNGFGRTGIALNSGSHHNTVRGCYAGTDSAGTTAIPNGYSGIGIWNGAHDNTIGGPAPEDRNVVSGNAQHGIIIDSGANANLVTGNYMGLNARGTTAVPNSNRGVFVLGGAFGNTIRGNVLSGNAWQGIGINGSGSDSQVIEGNYIGTNPAGTAAIPNTIGGVVLWQGPKNNRIGGTASGTGNLISGNTSYGIWIENLGTDNNVVQGNFIGLNAAGTAALGNSTAGVYLYDQATNNVVGPGNVISGNGSNGVLIDSGSHGNQVFGNYIGTNAAGTAAVTNATRGVLINAGSYGNTIGGTTPAERNIISGNTWQGVGIVGSGSDNNVILGNYLGTNAAGTAAIPNLLSGVILFGGPKNNVIGGTSPGAGNVVSGNSSTAAIFVRDTGADGTIIQGNLIGLNATGTSPIANTGSGVYVYNGATNTVVGPGNVICGNTSSGVRVETAGTTGTVVKGNWIGLRMDGTVMIPNTSSGVYVYNGPANTTVGPGNFISGNAANGVQIEGPSTAGTVVKGNWIGMSPTGDTAANNFNGVLVFAAATGTVIGGAPGSGNVISGNVLSGIRISGTGTNNTSIKGNLIGVNPVTGGDAANQSTGITVWSGAQSVQVGGSGVGDANTIRGNVGEGVFVRDSTTKFVNIWGNSIDNNSGLGIRLSNSSNDSILAPTLNSAVAGNGLQVTGSLSGAANTSHRLDFFASPAASTSGQGRTFLSYVSVTTNSAGSASFNFVTGSALPAGLLVSATATNPNGSTSAFASYRTVTSTDSDGDGIPDAWEAVHGMNPLLNDAASDDDGDGATNWQEYLAGTNVHDPKHRLATTVSVGTGGDVSIDLTAIGGRSYRIEKRSSLSGSTPWVPFIENFYVTGPTLHLTDPGAAAASSSGFYRAMVLP